MRVKVEAQFPAVGSSKEPDLKEAKKEPEGVGDGATSDKEPEAGEKTQLSQDKPMRAGVERSGSSGIPLTSHQDMAYKIRDVGQVARRGREKPWKEKESIVKEYGAKKECSDPGKGCVPDMGPCCCLDPEGNGAGIGEEGEARTGLPERGKDRQLKPSKGRDNMGKDEEE